ncbi:MAG: serine/threonine protein kinase [Mycolicibacterium cosmeticum]|nr:serine/threonine protein kinase [Mycolicibacterium cosmeticum]
MTTTEDRIRAALPGYDLGGQIGRGGCGVVLSGTHRMLARPVAIKQIPSQFAEDPVIRRRFAAEAQLMAAIDHPHVVPVYDFIEHDGLCLLVMEYLPGGTVGERFSTDGFDTGSAIAVALACAAGLQAAHAHGVLHRDIKPANLMFTAGGTVKLTDFGIAKIVGGDDTLVTRAGEIVGTPSYIAPEQARGQEVSPATDVYALATMVYQLLSGVLPFPAGEDSMAVLFMHAFEQPTPLAETAPTIPKPIADVVMRGLATDPTDRFDSAEAFGVALAEPAVDSWGSNWLTPVGIPVIGSDTIVAAATGQRSARAASHTGTALRDPAHETDTTQRTPVKPTQPLPRARIELVDVGRHDIAPVQEIVKFRSPRVPFAIAAVLGLAAVAIALMGLGAPVRGGDLPPGTVTIAGVDPAASDDIAVDMAQPIPVTVSGVPAGEVALGWNIFGSTVGRHATPLTPGPSGGTAEIPVPINPYLVAGRMTGELTVSPPGSAPLTYRFGMQSAQSPKTTALAVATVALALFAASYIESYIRALRRGRSRISGIIGVPLSAAGLGVAVVGAAWILLGHEPTVTALAGTATLAAAAGFAATLGAMRIGYKFRYRRSRRARELSRRRSR